MVQFTYTPSKESRLISVLYVISTLALFLTTVFVWVMSFLLGKWFFVAVVLTLGWLILFLACMTFSNYEISFVDNQLVIRNWRRKIKKIDVETLNKKVFVKQGWSTTFLIFLDEVSKQSISTRFGSLKYQAYLQSIGFFLQNSSRYGQFYYKDAIENKSQD